MGMTVGLDYLIQWVDKGKVPPRAEYIAVDNDDKNDGSVLALDANGNAKGGVRNPYVDVPAYKFGAPNEANPTPIPNPAAAISGRGANGASFFCGIAGYQLPLSKEQMQVLYKNKNDYRNKVEQRTNQLIKEGWISPVYKDLILADAAKVSM
jgi:hypothetical protein